MNYKIILKILGLLLLLSSAFMALSVFFSLYYNDNDIPSLLISVGISAGMGLLLWLIFKKTRTEVGIKEGYLLVSITWVIISLFGALPFYISGYIPSYTDAFFETMSGFTTTGASILTDIESLPHGLLFWRSMTHWLGGMGIIVLSLAILPFLGIGGMQLFAAESPGLNPDKLHPRIKDTARRLWMIYFGFTITETILLMFGGMSLFDALCHAFGTMATGGFSTKNSSIAEFSPYIQYVIIIFMFLAGINFSLHYHALKLKLKKVYKNEELRFYSIIIILSIVIIGTLLVVQTGKSIEPAFRSSAFQVISIVTTTGFITEDYMLWPSYLWVLIFLLMFTGGCAGSTGGGIKSIRNYLLFKNTSLSLKRLVHPRALIPVRYNHRVVHQDVIYNVLAFFLMYMIIFALGTFIMAIMGLDFESSIGSVAATLGNIGPGIGSVCPVCNYAHIPDIGKWFLSFLMLLGRLELFTVLVIFAPSFWKD